MLGGFLLLPLITTVAAIPLLATLLASLLSGYVALVMATFAEVLLASGRRIVARAFLDLAAACALYIGSLPNNSAAVLKGLLGHGGAFERTPKSRAEAIDTAHLAAPPSQTERPALHWTFFLNVAVTLFAVAASIVMTREGHPMLAIPEFMFAAAMNVVLIEYLRGARLA
jgi:hypothetical protein